jgi:hypothetical protein
MARLYVAGELVDANWPEPKRTSTGNHVYTRSKPCWDEKHDNDIRVLVFTRSGDYAVFIPNVYWGTALGRDKVEVSWHRVHHSNREQYIPDVFRLERMILN